jgi:hypothetical protein
MAFGNKTFPAVTIATSLADVFEWDVSDLMTLGIAIENTGVAFNAFELSAKVSDDAAWTVLGSIAGDFSTPVYPLRRTVGAPVTLANGAKATIFLDVMHLSRVRVRASVASSTTSVVARLGGK